MLSDFWTLVIVCAKAIRLAKVWRDDISDKYYLMKLICSKKALKKRRYNENLFLTNLSIC